MCHASRRAERHLKSYYSHHHSDRAEHHEHDERHAHHDRGERIRCFMAHHDHHRQDWDRSEGRSGLGVRRPLRFLAHKLDLDEKQITELARILNDLKTERAQAEVISGESFDASKASSAGERRVQSTVKVREALVRALEQIHALLNADQRQRLAYLIRTGVLTI
jgi:hypothetical protein